MAFVRKIFTPKGAPRWQARWTIPGPNGTPIEKARNFATQKDAKDFAAKMLEEGERRGSCCAVFKLMQLLGWLCCGCQLTSFGSTYDRKPGRRLG